MELITLKSLPNLRFPITLGGNNYDVHIFSTVKSMTYDIDINGVNVIKGFEMVNDAPLLVYPHQEVNGNIVLSLPDDEVPDYKAFGLSQFLYFLDADETIAYREAYSL